MQHNAIIKVGKYHSHKELTSQLEVFSLAAKGDKIDFKLYLNPGDSIVYPDHLLLIACALNGCDARGVDINGVISCSSGCEGYVSRMNFYDSVGIFSSETFTRRSSAGRFLEISKFTNPTHGNDLIDKILEIFIAQNVQNESVMAAIGLCLAELVSNVYDHSEQDHGWIVAQYYPKLKCIRMIVADPGQGIHKSLTTNPKEEKYKQFTSVEALENCIKDGVTNGTGMGKGLYITANFIQQNGGTLLLQSGNDVLTINKNGKYMSQSGFWNGTIVFLQINSNVPIDTSKINNGRVEFVEMYNDWFDQQ